MTASLLKKPSNNHKAREARAPVGVLYVIGSLDLGGTEKQLYLLLKHLDRQRFRPCVVSLSEGGYWEDRIAGLDVELFSLKRSGSYEVRRLLALVHLMNQQNPHIVHGYQPPGNAYAGMATMLTRRFKMVSSCRSFDHEVLEKPLMGKVYEQLTYVHADAVVCNSQALSSQLESRYDGKVKAVVIPNGIENPSSPTVSGREDRLRESLGIPADAMVIGTVGRLVPIKNHRLFLDIAHLVKRHCPRSHFVIVGDGPLENELKTHADSLGIAGSIHFTGRREDVIEVMKAFDIFLFTSGNGDGVGEGSPNVVIEALLNGLPCVASNAGGTAELFADATAGYLVPPHDEDAYLNRTLSLIENKALRAELGECGRRLVLERFSTHAMAARFQELYESLLAPS